MKHIILILFSFLFLTISCNKEAEPTTDELIAAHGEFCRHIEVAPYPFWDNLVTNQLNTTNDNEFIVISIPNTNNTINENYGRIIERFNEIAIGHHYLQVTAFEPAQQNEALKICVLNNNTLGVQTLQNLQLNIPVTANGVQQQFVFLY